jgi:hypothetical protein
VQRHHVSADGSTVLESKSLTKSCAVLDYAPKVTPMITHVLSDAPMEHHVWANRVMKQDLFVGIESTLWEVKDGKVSKVK